LFERLAMIYGTDKMQALWRGQEFYAVKDFWAEELGSFSADELRKAFAALDKHPSWPPTLIEFKALCRPTAGSVNHEAMFYEAVRAVEKRKQGEMGSWSCKAVYWAALDVSAADVLGMTWPQIKGRWTQALDARLADPNLPVIPEPAKRLPAPEVPIDRNLERVHEMLATLTGPKKDHRVWVQAILDRKARNDATLSDYAYRMALKSADIR
jgi:hypothetical protein